MNIFPLKKCEYVVWKAPGAQTPGGTAAPQTEYRYDVTLVWEDTAHTVKVCLLDKRARNGVPFWIPIGAPGAFPVRPAGWVAQFGSYLIVTIYDNATYIAWPKAFSAPGQPFAAPWNSEILGLDECPTPKTYDFPLTLTGDLMVLAGQRAAQGDDIILEYQKVATSSSATSSSDEYANNVIIRLPLDATYWRAGWVKPNTDGSMPVDAGNLTAEAQAILSTELIARWKVANKDAPTAAQSETQKASREHIMHRGYFYRFIFVRKFTNADGNIVTIRSNPSVDLFVPAVNFAPFFWSVKGTNDKGSFDDTQFQGGYPGFPNFIRADVDQDQWRQSVDWSHESPPANSDGGDPFNPLDGPYPAEIPSHQAFSDLQAKYRAYFVDSSLTASDGAGDNGNALQWAAQWLGWSTQANSVNNTRYQNQPPWICEASAEQITQAPQTIFDWMQFGFINNGDGTYSMIGVPGTIDLIEVYRTAYEDVDPVARPVTTPLFQPHIYGLVGTIAPGAKFTDTTKIPDFGEDPGAFEGYLRGQFSGDIEFDYGQSPALVLGNIRDDYKIQPPSNLIQAFRFFGASVAGAYVAADFVASAGPGSDGLDVVSFSFAYQDTSGYRSAATPIARPDAPAFQSDPHAVAFTFPYGFDPNIANIVLYISRFTAGNPGARAAREVIVPPEPGTYISTGAPTEGSAVSPAAAAGTFSFYEPGAIIYSLPDEPWMWPPAQAEKHSSESPVRGLFDMMGELAVVTDAGYTLTLLRASAPRSEAETKKIGLITKHASAKIEDVVCVLSQHGVYFLVPSRAEELPSHVQVQLLPYLTELIANAALPQMPLAALRRASMGYLARRKELWLHIPSSVDLWPNVTDVTGALALPNPSAEPQRTFIFRFLDGIRKIKNYTFDITPDFELKNISQRPASLGPAGRLTGGLVAGPDMVDITTFNSTQVLFSEGSDGGLYASWCDLVPGSPTLGNLITIDCDVPTTDYDGSAYLTVALGLEEPTGQKQIERTELLMRARGEVQMITGIPKQDGGASGVQPVARGGNNLLAGWDAIRGFIHNAARVATFRRIVTDQERKYNRPASGSGIETKGTTVMVRVRTTPDAQGRHKVTLNGLTVYFDPRHEHG